MAPRKRRGRTSGAQSSAAAGSASNSMASSPSSHPQSKSSNDSFDRSNASRMKNPDVSEPRSLRDSFPAEKAVLHNGDTDSLEDDPKAKLVSRALEDAHLLISEKGGEKKHFTVAGVVTELYKQMIDWAVTDIAVQFKRNLFLAAEAERQADIISAGGLVKTESLPPEERSTAEACPGSYGSRLLYSEKNVTVECSNCGSNISASRYAQHVEKCLGRGGRMSSRAASARLRASAERAEKEAAADMEDAPPRRRRSGTTGLSDSENLGYGNLHASKRRKMSPVPSGGSGGMSQGSYPGRGGLPPSGRTRASPP